MKNCSGTCSYGISADAPRAKTPFKVLAVAARSSRRMCITRSRCLRRSGVAPGAISGLSARNWKSAAVRNKFSSCTRTQELCDPQNAETVLLGWSLFCQEFRSSTACGAPRDNEYRRSEALAPHQGRFSNHALGDHLPESRGGPPPGARASSNYLGGGLPRCP